MRRVLGGVLIALVAAALVLESPAVQTRLAATVKAKLEQSRQELGFEIGSLQILPFSSFIATDLLITDKTPSTYDPHGLGFAPEDTVIYAGKVCGTLSLRGLLAGHGLHLFRLSIEDANLNVVQEPGDKWPNNINRIFQTPEKKDEAKPLKEVLSASIVRVGNFHVRIKNFKERPREYEGIGIDWRNIDAVAVEMKAHSFKMKNGKAFFVVDQLEATEKSGYHLLSARGRADVGMGRAIVEKVRLKDQWSDVRVPRLVIKHGFLRNLRNYNELVKMEIEVGRSVVGIPSLRYMGDKTVSAKDYIINIEKGSAEGYVSDLFIKDIVLSESLTGLRSRLSGRITGIGIRSNKGIYNVDLQTPGTSLPFGKNSVLSFKGKVNGPCNRLRVKGGLDSGHGTADVHLDVRNALASTRDIELSGNLAAENLDIGAISGLSWIGECTLAGAFRSVLHKGNPSVIVDSLRAESVTLLGYEYENIYLRGRFSDKKPDGTLEIDDDALRLKMSGNSENFYVDVARADLVEMNLEKRFEKMVASGRLDVSGLEIKNGNLTGKAVASNLVSDTGRGPKLIGSAVLESDKPGEKLYTMKLKADFADAIYSGSRPAPQMLKRFGQIIADKYLPSLLSADGAGDGSDGETFALKADFHDSRNLLAVVKPGLYIADSTSVSLNLTPLGEIGANVRSGRLAFGKNSIKSLSFRSVGSSEGIVSVLEGDEICLGKSSISKDRLSVKMQNDSIAISGGFGVSESDCSGVFSAAGRLGRTALGRLSVRGNVYPSAIRIKNDEWVTEGFPFLWSPGKMKLEGMSLRNGEQSILIDGGWSASEQDSLSINVNSLSIGMVDYLLGRNSGLGGRLNGSGIVISPVSRTYDFRMGFSCDSLVSGGSNIGKLSLNTNRNTETGRIELDATGDNEGHRTFSMHGHIEPGSRRLSAEAFLDGFNLAIAGPFLKSVFSDVKGSASGRIRLGGTGNRPVVTSENLRIDSALVRLAATQVPYTLRGPVSIDSTGIVLQGIAISDTLKGHGMLKGTLSMNGLQPERLNGNVTMNGLRVLNIPYPTEKGFYGILDASGDLSVSGPLDKLNVGGMLASAGAGNVNIPLGKSVEATRSKLLTFKNHEDLKPVDPYEEMMGTLQMPVKEKARGSIAINVTARISEQTEVAVEIDKSTGNILKARGDGSLSILAGGGRPLNINGDYNIRSGRYDFVVPGIVSKEFKIQDGSRLRFYGPIPETEMDMKAEYRLKTTIATLTADTTSVSSRRPVVCTIDISDKLSNPSIDFGVEVPDLDPTTRTQVEAALNTPDKVQKQFVALLVMGMFLPDDRGSIENSSNILYSNLSQVVSGQLNGIFQKLDIPIDLGLGYQQTKNGNNLFDVAVSTQLFNDRVLVNGTVGNRRGTGGGNGDDVVGDVDVEVKLNKTGNVRLKLFSHSADQYTSFLDKAQRNGVGISFSKEFTTFSDLWRSIFGKKPGKKQNKFKRENEQVVSDTVSIGR